MNLNTNLLTDSVLDLIGNTPTVRLPESVTGCKANVYCKLEFFNPGGSIKDRMAKYIICEEERRGAIKPGDTICDNTSGNAGAAVAMVASVKGYKTVFTTPEKTSKEKVDVIRSYGAEIIITPTDVAADDPRHCYEVAKRLAQEKGYYWLNQYDNPLNPEAHYKTTGPEIWEQFGERLTHIVIGIGTGGTISGIGRYLKEKKPDIEIIGADPKGSLFKAIVEGTPLPEPVGYKVEGIGTDKVVNAFQREYCDRVIQVSDNDSFLQTRYLTRTTGLSVGGSTGTSFQAVQEISRDLDKSATVLFLAADGGIRYISKLFNDDWMRQLGFRLEGDTPG